MNYENPQRYKNGDYICHLKRINKICICFVSLKKTDKTERI